MPHTSPPVARRARSRGSSLLDESHACGACGSKEMGSNTMMDNPKPKPKVRPGHEWYLGVPGTWTDDDLFRLSGRYLACPGCTIDDYNRGACHTRSIINKFRVRFPDHCPPTFVSAATRTIEGRGGHRDVLINLDAVWAGCRPPRGAPIARELGTRLPCSKFGNPEKVKAWAEAKQQRAEKRLREEEDGL